MKTKKAIRSVIYSSIILSSFLAIIGILLIMFREHIVNYINYIFIFVLLQNLLFNVYLYVKYKKKYLLPFLFTSLICNIAIIILNIIDSSKIINVVAIIMGISTVFEIIEGITELFSKDIDNSWLQKAVEIATICIHTFFAVELFTTLGASVPTHLLIYGIVFMVHGLESILKIIIERRKIKEEYENTAD